MSYPNGSGQNPQGKIYSGPVSNVTCRMDQAIAQHIGTPHKDEETKSQPTCLRNDLLVTCDMPGANATSVQHVTSMDLLEFHEVSAQQIGDYKVYVPTDYAQYTCDVHDARTRAELVMAANQMCLLRWENGKPKSLVPDPRVYHSGNNNAGGYAFTIPDDGIVLRRNVIWNSRENGGENEELKQFVTELNKKKEKLIVETFDLSDKNVPKRLRDIFYGIGSKNNIYCTHKGTVQKLVPPRFSYAGIAMTDAFLNSANGDTHVTSNLFSSITLNNGPVAVAHGDRMHWIWRVELNYYTKDGIRLPRRSWLDEEGNKGALYESQVLSVENLLYGHAAAGQRDSKMLQRVCRNIMMIPLKEGFAYNMMSAGHLDRTHQRLVGHAITSSQAFGSIDLLNNGKGTNS